jgi:hypothetical protein
MHNETRFSQLVTRACLAAVAVMLVPGLASAQSLPTGWATAAVGTPLPGGAATFTNGVFTVNAGGGKSVGGNADEFRMVYRTLNGDGTIVAKVATVNSGSPRAAAGLVIRDSLAPGSRNASLIADTDSGGATLAYRPATGGRTYATGRKSLRAPGWLRLTRTGNSVAAAISNDGRTWTQMGSVAVPLNTTVLAGLAVASGWQGVDANVTFSDVNGVTAAASTAPANTVPTVSLATPVGPFTAPATVTLNATASDADGSVARVDFYQGTTLLGSDSTSPYAHAWTGAPAGSYTFRAIAVDNAGASSAAASATATVAAANQAPTVSLAAPAGSLTAPATLTLTASAADADGTVARVDFYQGSALLGSDSSSPYSFVWGSVPAGAYTLRAVAIDNAGASGTSAPVSATVVAPNQAPTVSLAAPAGPFTAPAAITLNATAADADGTIARVDFYQGSALLGSDASAPYAFGWTNVAAGTYSLRAVAVDNAGATGTSATIGVTVASAPNQVPTVSLATPAGPFTAPAAIALSATAADADGTVARVDFYQGAVLLGSDASAPYAFSWSNVVAGTYSLRAVAVDNAGGSGTSATISVTVASAPANSAPTVSLTAPTAGSSVAAPATITVSATAADPDGTVARVDFYQGTALIGSDASSPYSVAWSNVPAGSYTFTAVAFDNAGASTRSAGVTATVTAPQAPTVSLTSPVTGTSFVGPASVAMTATASDADGTVARVDFYQGTTLLGSDTSSPYAFAWTNVAVGSYSLTAIATDNSGATTASSTVQVQVTASNLPQNAVWVPSDNDATAVSTYIIEVFPNGVNTTTANPVATQDAGKPAQVNGEYVADIRSMVTALPAGSYVATVTAVGSEGSAQSAPSPVFTK